MIPAVIRSVFSLPNIRRGPTYTGVLDKWVLFFLSPRGTSSSIPADENGRFQFDIVGTKTDLYISNQGTISPFPASLLIEVRSFFAIVPCEC